MQLYTFFKNNYMFFLHQLIYLIILHKNIRVSKIE